MRKISLLLASVVLAALAFAPAVAARPSSGLTIPVDATVVGGTLTDATFTLDRFAAQGDQLVAVGTLSGTLTNTATGVVTTITQAITLPVTTISASCDILHLELGPLDLNLLGLQVHLDKIVLDIDAESGPGNLLGNLLCAVAGLLDNGGALNTIARLLNNILAIFG